MGLITEIGLKLSSTDKILLKKVGSDKFSIIKQCILGYSLFIPPIIAFFAFKHLFGLITDNPYILIPIAILGALTILFIDFAFVFFMSLYQRGLVFVSRIIYSLIVGFFLAVIATIGFNEDHLVNLHNKEIEEDRSSETDSLINSISNYTSLISQYAIDGETPPMSYIYLRILDQDELKRINEEIGKKTLGDSIFEHLALIFDQIKDKKNYRLGAMVLIFLLLLISFDIIPILLKMIGFKTKYDVACKTAYYLPEGDPIYDRDSLINEIGKRLSYNPNLTIEEIKENSKLLKTLRKRLEDQLSDFSYISLVTSFFKSTREEAGEGDDEGPTKTSDIVQKFILPAIFTLPEFIFTIIFLEHQQIDNIVLYVGLLSVFFYINKFILNSLLINSEKSKNHD